jgi:metal-responsive CopG/Arc/MetJ family transcriptional regulator
MMSMTARKVKISISIDAALLANLDRYAASKRVTRSAALERWLAQAEHREKLNRLELETAAYYDSLTDAERREDAELAASSSRNFRKLDIDGPKATLRFTSSPKRPARRSRK